VRVADLAKRPKVVLFFDDAFSVTGRKLSKRRNRQNAFHKLGRFSERCPNSATPCSQCDQKCFATPICFAVVTVLLKNYEFYASGKRKNET
jgi:hypothetical protein